MFSTSVRGGKAFAAKQKIREPKKKEQLESKVQIKNTRIRRNLMKSYAKRQIA